MELKYVDAHCHLQFDDYDADSDALIARMREESVAGIVVGVDLESSKKALALAEKHEHLYASVGLHPNSVAGEIFNIEEYRKLAENPKVIAIGECGLDYYRPAEVNEEVKRKQREALLAHIELAAELDKPLIIHCRPSKGTPRKIPEDEASRGKMDTYQDLIQILTEAKITYPNVRGAVHFFVGGIAEAQELIALGFTVSFTAVITFARDYDAVIKSVPLTSILSETDAPYVAPEGRRRKRNDPLAVVEVVSKIAEIRGENLDTVRAALLANARLVFGLPVC